MMTGCRPPHRRGVIKETEGLRGLGAPLGPRMVTRRDTIPGPRTRLVFRPWEGRHLPTEDRGKEIKRKRRKHTLLATVRSRED